MLRGSMDRLSLCKYFSIGIYYYWTLWTVLLIDWIYLVDPLHKTLVLLFPWVHCYLLFVLWRGPLALFWLGCRASLMRIGNIRLLWGLASPTVVPAGWLTRLLGGLHSPWARLFLVSPMPWLWALLLHVRSMISKSSVAGQLTWGAVTVPIRGADNKSRIRD